MADSTAVVILGATGDLSQRKLIPALFNLQCKKRLPDGLRIVGSGRREMSHEQFRSLCREGTRKIGELNVSDEEWNSFARRIFYADANLTSSEALRQFSEKLSEIEGGASNVNRLFYLSIAPNLYEPTVIALGGSGLASETAGWRRVVIEKPFGYDLASAIHLNGVVQGVFREDQVFRIDHYLGKETVQNLLVLRFANAIFEPIWNRNYIDNVQITVAESVDVEDRGAYYDESGVIRDMVQNHVLQLLTLVAMEPPSIADAESLRNKKMEVLQAIRGWHTEKASSCAVRGQYQGYRDTEGIKPTSNTPTYCAIRLFIDNWRWQGVPFYLRTGKALAEKDTEIVIEFHEPPHSMFELGPDQMLPPNLLGICLQPDEGTHLRFGVKVPDAGMTVQSVDMQFHYRSSFKDLPIPEAYELLLEDALQGDASLFIRADQIEGSWRVVEPLLHTWEDHEVTPLHIYPRGSWGPDAADRLLSQDGRVWRRACGDSAHDQHHESTE